MGGGDCQTLKLVGVIYPPVAQQVGRSGQLTVADECEEFTEVEINKLVSDLPGIPVLFEHDESKLVGRVTAARRIHAGGVEVTASIHSDTDVGRETIQALEREELYGLSLGHQYQMDASAPNILKVQMSSKGDKLAPIAANSFPHTVHKFINELSVCKEPRREGCFIREIVRASAKYKQANEKEKTENIYVGSAQSQQKTGPHQKSTASSFVGIFKCSIKTSEIESNSGKVVENTQMEATQVATEPDAQQTPVESTDAVAAPAVEADEVSENSKAFDRARDDRGRFVSQKKEETPEPTPAEATEQDTGKAEEINQMSDEKLEAMINDFHAKYSEMQEQVKQAGEAIKQANERTRLAEEEQKKALEQTELLKQEQQKQKEMIKKQAADRKQKAFDSLSKLISSGTASNPLTSAHAVDMKTGTESNEPLLSLGDNDVAQNVQQANILEQARKLIDSQNNQMQEQQVTQNKKRERTENVNVALQNFSGLLANTPVAGTVNASAADQPAVKRQGVVFEEMQKFRQQNPDASWHSYRNHYKTVCRPVMMSGEVKASKNWSWNPAAEAEVQQNSQTTDLNAAHLHPEFFKYASSLNTGRIVSNNDASSLVQGINQQSQYPRPY